MDLYAESPLDDPFGMPDAREGVPLIPGRRI